MKFNHYLTLTLCAILSVAMLTFAEDDLISSASGSSIPDPVNPQPGMVFKGYNISYEYYFKNDTDFNNLPKLLEECTTVKTAVVETESFSWSQFKNTKIEQGVWEGFLKCKRSATCTILIKQRSTIFSGCWLFVNGKKVRSGRGQMSVDVDMKAGFNHIKVIAAQDEVTIYLSPKNSTKEPKPVKPAIMFHDEQPEDDVI